MNTCENSAKNKFFAFINQNRIWWLLGVCIIGVGLDQSTKILAQKFLAEPYEVQEEQIISNQTQVITKKVFYPIKIVEIIPNFFNLIYKENPAAAFSLTLSIPAKIRKPLLVGVSIIATIFFLVWYMRMRAQDGLLLFSFSFILAGALGNLIDRFRLGYVIDFLDIHAGLLGYPYMHWPTFNIADSFIVVGAIFVVYRTIWPFAESRQTLDPSHTHEAG